MCSPKSSFTAVMLAPGRRGVDTIPLGSWECVGMRKGPAVMAGPPFVNHLMTHSRQKVSRMRADVK